MLVFFHVRIFFNFICVKFAISVAFCHRSKALRAIFDGLNAFFVAIMSIIDTDSIMLRGWFAENDIFFRSKKKLEKWFRVFARKIELFLGRIFFDLTFFFDTFFFGRTFERFLLFKFL